jgi:hypothetical protein
MAAADAQNSLRAAQLILSLLLLRIRYNDDAGIFLKSSKLHFISMLPIGSNSVWMTFHSAIF